MEKVLVTGAEGFIGSHLVEALVARGNKVRAVVWYNAHGSFGWLDHLPPETMEHVEVVLSDIRDFIAMRNAVQGCAVIYHLAALIGIPYSYHAVESYVDTNVKGTMNLLLAAKDCGVRKFVNTSTSEVYGNADDFPISERQNSNAYSPYAATKIAADQLALSFFHAYDMPVAIIRPFNTFGPRQSARAVIPTVISQIVRGAQRVRMGALTPKREFCYVKDTVSAFIAVAESERSIGEVINVGSGFEIAVGEIPGIVAGILGREVAIECDESRIRPTKSEIHRLLSDIGKAEALLGWRPQYGGREGFARGLAEMIAWFQDERHQELYKNDRYNI